MSRHDDFINIAALTKPARAGLGDSISSSASSPLQTGYKKQEPGILLYPSDVGTNIHQASYILFARHEVQGAKVKPVRKSGPKVRPVRRDLPGGLGDEIDRAATKILQDKADDAYTADQLGTISGSGGANRGADGKMGASNSLLLQRRNIKKTGTFIGLYMPPAVNVQYSMDYSDAAEIGVMGEALYGLFKDYQDGTLTLDSFNKSAGTVGTGLEKWGVGLIDKVIPGAKDLYAIENGTIITPRTEMMFKGIGRRSFSFSFTFIPKNHTESGIVHKIVKEFKVGMTPSFKVAGSTREMTIPDVFSIQYMHINGPNNYINKIGKCYLKTMDVTYGGDKFVTYNADKLGAPPQKTTISLAFQELEVLDRANMMDDY